MKKNFMEIAKFEFLKVIRKKSFWIATLFIPVFIGLIAFISASSSLDANKQMEDPIGFSKIYVRDLEKVINEVLLVNPFERIESEEVEKAKKEVKKDNTIVLVVFSETFTSDMSYEIYYGRDSDFIGSAALPSVINAMIKQSATMKISDQSIATILNSSLSATTYVSNDEGNFVKEGYEKYLLPVISVLIFFLAVYISSSFLLQSVSAEKENRMIETILSMVDKKALMVGKMFGLISVMFLQLVIWTSLGFGIYKFVMNGFDLPFPIDFSNIDLSLLPLNIFLIVAGFLFFASIMIGVGAIGTGAEDSRNLSSIFILLSIFPVYLMQILVTNPNGTIAIVLSYFPFTSFMILLIRNSFGALPLHELIIGICTSILYVIVSIFLAFKLFELGCLMYNRRPSFKEILEILGKHN